MYRAKLFDMRNKHTLSAVCAKSNCGVAKRSLTATPQIVSREYIGLLFLSILLYSLA